MSNRFLEGKSISCAGSELMNAKYKWGQGLIVELEPLNFGKQLLDS
ncbi:MAG TPA: hypothetical protein VFY55_04805 [Nitrososphaeraceae archaeon]|nr:hypothetical protein [Nitrososphaeraceae archaeon]